MFYTFVRSWFTRHSNPARWQNCASFSIALVIHSHNQLVTSPTKPSKHFHICPFSVEPRARAGMVDLIPVRRVLSSSLALAVKARGANGPSWSCSSSHSSDARVPVLRSSEICFTVPEICSPLPLRFPVVPVVPKRCANWRPDIYTSHPTCHSPVLPAPGWPK